MLPAPTLTCQYLRISTCPSPSTPVTHINPLLCATPVCSWFGPRSFILTSCFFGLAVCVLAFLALVACHIIAHNGQTCAHPPPYFFGPFVLLFPGILPYPRVHRPPKSREACKDHGASGRRALGQRIPTPPDPGWLANELCPSMGTSGDGNPDWVGKTSSTLPRGRPVLCAYCTVRYRTAGHRTALDCLTAYDPHSSRPHFFKSGHTAWHGTKESTWYLARNYHEPSTSLQGRGPQGQASQSQPGYLWWPSAPYYYVQQTCALIPASGCCVALARVCRKVASLRVPLYGTVGLVGR